MPCEISVDRMALVFELLEDAVRVQLDVTNLIQGATQRRTLQTLRLEERSHELAIFDDEFGEPSLFPRELLRVFEGAFEDEPCDRINVDGRRLTP